MSTIRVAQDPDDERGFIYVCLNCAHDLLDKAKIEFANSIVDPDYDFQMYHSKDIALRCLREKASDVERHYTDAMLHPVCDEGDNLIYLRCLTCDQRWGVNIE